MYCKLIMTKSFCDQMLSNQRLVGWGHDEADRLYWIAINSWGDQWGENGRFRVDTSLVEVWIVEYWKGRNIWWSLALRPWIRNRIIHVTYPVLFRMPKLIAPKTRNHVSTIYYLHLSETQNIINFHFLNPIKPLPGIKNQTCFVLTIY